MAYQVIARKWRPQKFSDMVGQEHLARTLRNAIMTDRTAHAYLFVGPRGIGKTTTARIFAKALNCEHPIDGEPCCQCESCRAIAEERNVDVIEIDAATHTQVDKARELCEDVLTLPIHSRYKIYIIDEVHMLSTAAWNALLKTIEEPPPHAKFIFATTEVNKVLPTVISRCQRFDLKRIKTADIAGRLRLICDTEKVKICDEALQIIARAADGGMRDAQSLLDQVISFFGTDNGEAITEAQTLSLFGLAASGDMVELMKAMLTNDRSTAIKMIWQFAEAGKNLEILYEEVISWLRCTLLSSIVDNPAEIIDEGAEKASLYMNLASLTKSSVVQRLLEQLSASAYQLREALNKQVFMEAIVLKAMRLAHAVQIEDLIARLTQLRNQGELNAVGSVVPLYEMPAGQIVVPKDYSLAPAVNRNREMKTISADDAKKIADAAGSAVSSTASAPAVQPIQPSAELQKKNDLSGVPPTQETAKAIPVQPAKVEPEHTVAPVLERPVPVTPPPQPRPVQAAPVQQNSIPPAPQFRPVQNDSIPSMDTDDVEIVDDYDMLPPEDGNESAHTTYHNPEQIWDSLIMDVRDCLKMAALASAMEEGTPVEIYNGVLRVIFDEEYEQMQYSIVGSDITLLSRRLQEISSGTVNRLDLELQAGFATPQQVEKRVSTEKLREDMLHNPFIRQTIRQFSGALTDVFTEEELKNDQKEK